jgi:hypothetical protein
MKTISVIQKFENGNLIKEFVSQIEIEKNEVIGFMLSSDREKCLYVDEALAPKVIALIRKPAISETTVVAVIEDEAIVPWAA